MDYDLIQNLGCAIDNVYNNVSEKPDRRTTTKIINDMLIVEYQTIITIAKDADFKHQMDMVKSESKQMIDSRLKSVKECFKESSGKSLKAKKEKDYDRVETLTVSPYSPIRTYKYSFCVEYGIS
jgi:glutamate formiminotransferase